MDCRTSYVTAGEVTTLKHELGDNSVEGGVLETSRLARLEEAVDSIAELSEVLNGLGSQGVEKLQVDSA